MNVMRLLARVAIGLILSRAIVSAAQTPKPAFVYTLHALKERRTGFTVAPTLTLPSTIFMLSPDNSLLVLLPQEDGVWVLKRLTDWDTATPHEQTLSIAGKKVGDEQISVTTDVAVNPSGTSLIVRLTYRHVAFGSKNPPAPEAVIVLVDLGQFNLISRRVTSDPLLATSQWRFAGDTSVVAKHFLSASAEQVPSPHSTGSNYEAATLGFPDLTPRASCRYDEATTCDTTGSCEQEISKTANLDCEKFLQTAGIQSLSSILATGGKHPRMHLPTGNCSVSATTASNDLTFLECRTGRGYLDGEIYITKSRTATVLASPEEKPILTIPLPHNFHEIPGVLAASDGVKYLLLLRDGIKLEGYRLPVSP